MARKKTVSKRVPSTGLRPEYTFDYEKSRPNRFAKRVREGLPKRKKR